MKEHSVNLEDSIALGAHRFSERAKLASEGWLVRRQQSTKNSAAGVATLAGEIKYLLTRNVSFQCFDRVNLTYFGRKRVSVDDDKVRWISLNKEA